MMPASLTVKTWLSGTYSRVNQNLCRNKTHRVCFLDDVQISVRSPRKLSIFIIQKHIHRIKAFYLILEKALLVISEQLSACSVFQTTAPALLFSKLNVTFFWISWSKKFVLLHYENNQFSGLADPYFGFKGTTERSGLRFETSAYNSWLVVQWRYVWFALSQQPNPKNQS